MYIPPDDFDQPRFVPPDPVSDADFEARIMPVLLRHEGGLVDHPDDPGGITKYGISLRWLRAEGVDVDGDGDIDAADVRGLTHQQAVALYRTHFWQGYGYARLCNVALAGKIFDLAVNMGPSPACRVLQRALRACGRPVAEDGALGPCTIEAALGLTLGGGLLPAIRAEAAGHYRALIAKNPKLAAFETGWLNRAYA
jgi:lysozyme family protein